MNKKTMQRQAEILVRYPSIKVGFEELCATRCYEILDELLRTDTDYQALTQQRANTSQIILDILNNHDAVKQFEAYSSAVYAEEVYELDVIYREAFLDAVEMIERQKLL